MRENIKHINSRGEVLDFNQLGILMNYNDLRDYEWNASTSNGKITGFSKGIGKKTIPFIFSVDEQNAAEIKNKFYEHFDIDVRNQKKGYFEINGYRFYCYLTKSVKSDYLISKKLLILKATLQTDDDEWRREVLNTINFSTLEIDGGLTYPFTYPFTYAGKKTSRIVNESFVECDAIIRMYGVAENPLVKINDIVYQVNVSVANDEYLEIDTEKKTIFKFDRFGNKTNLFDYRDKQQDTFSKIPSGTLTVSANGKFRVDIVVIEKRGEPRWD